MAINEEYYEPSTIADAESDALSNPIDLTSSDTFIDKQEDLTVPLIAAATLAGGVGLYKTAKTGIKTLLDTQGYGAWSPVEKYKQDPKFKQTWSSAMQAGDRSRIKAVKEIGHSMTTGYPLELKAAKASIEEVKEELKNSNLSAQNRANKELELKSRTKNMAKRRGLLSNHYRALGVPSNQIPFNIGSDFEPTTIKVDRTLEKLDPASMKGKYGQRVLATKHTGEQIVDFKSYANRDPRVNHIRKLLDKGKVLEAKYAAKNAHYLKKGNIIIPSKNEMGLPVNKLDEPMGMKLRKLSNKVKYKGSYKPVYRLGFVPKIPQNLSSKLEYVSGQHYQYMDFVKTNGGYHRFRGGMRDVHNLTPHKFGRVASKAEELVAKPVVNYADWKYKIMTKARKTGEKTSYTKGTYMTKAYRRPYEYGKGEKVYRTMKTPAKSKTISKLAKSLFKGIVTKGRRW